MLNPMKTGMFFAVLGAVYSALHYVYELARGVSVGGGDIIGIIVSALLYFVAGYVAAMLVKDING